jgi:hypothetical protein
MNFLKVPSGTPQCSSIVCILIFNRDEYTKTLFSCQAVICVPLKPTSSIYINDFAKNANYFRLK